MRYKRNVPGHTAVALSSLRAPANAAEISRAADLLGSCSRVAILAGAGAHLLRL